MEKLTINSESFTGCTVYNKLVVIGSECQLIQDCEFESCNFIMYSERTELRECSFIDCNMRYSVHESFINCDFEECIIMGGDLYFYNSIFIESTFCNITLTTFENCDFKDSCVNFITVSDTEFMFTNCKNVTTVLGSRKGDIIDLLTGEIIPMNMNGYYHDIISL